MKYYFYPDKITLVISILCLIGLCYMVSYVVHSDKWYSILPTSLIIILFLFFAMKIPYSICIKENVIEVKQFIGTKRITDIEKIEKLCKKEFSNSIRKFGNGGFLGYTGCFYSPTIGHFNMFALNLDELVKVSTRTGEIYVINYPYDLLKQQTDSKLK